LFLKNPGGEEDGVGKKAGADPTDGAGSFGPGDPRGGSLVSGQVGRRPGAGPRGKGTGSPVEPAPAGTDGNVSGTGGGAGRYGREGSFDGWGSDRASSRHRKTRLFSGAEKGPFPPQRAGSDGKDSRFLRGI